MSSITARAPSQERTLPWWLDLLTTVDHKKIGLMYIVTSLIFFGLGGLAALLIRLQLSRPDLEIITGQVYNQVLTAHGTTMQFLFIIPIAVGFGNYFVPLMIGARDMALPRMNAFGYWMYLAGGILFYISPFLGGWAEGGWVSYVPYATSEYQTGTGMDTWILALQLIGFSSIFGGVNFVATIINLRTPGMGFRQIPMFVWATLATSFLQVLATPGISAATLLTFLDRNVGISFYNPAIGGDPVLYQHLFWFYSHPAVYIMVLPWFGIVSEILPTFTRKPIFGYTALAGATMGIALVSFLVWAHHMFTSMGSPILNSVFSFTTMLVAVPTGVKIFNWLATIWQGKIVFNTSMLMSMGFIFLFTIGGITGVALAIVPFTWQMHDSYWVVAHFHNILLGGSIFIIMAGIFYWFPKVTGRFLNEGLGKALFWLWFVGYNVTYTPHYILGLLGMPRRIYTYHDGIGWGIWNAVSSIGSFMLAAGFLLLIINIFLSLRRPKTAGADPWQYGYTLEWATASPPAAHNFDYELPSEFRSERPLYDWKKMGLWPPKEETKLRPKDIHLPNASIWPFVVNVGLFVMMVGLILHGPLVWAGLAIIVGGVIPWSVQPAFESEEIELEVAHHNRTKTNNGMLAASWFLGSEAALFAVIFAGFFYLLFTGRMAFPEELPSWRLALLNTVFLLSSSLTVHVAHHDLKHDKRKTFLGLMAVTVAFGTIFLSVTGLEWREVLGRYNPAENLYLSAFFTITGLHGLHVIVGLFMLTLALVKGMMGHFTPKLHNGVEVPVAYWHLVDGVWIFVLMILYILPNFYQGPERVISGSDPFAVYRQDTIGSDPGSQDTPIPILPRSDTPAAPEPATPAPGEPEFIRPGVGDFGDAAAPTDGQPADTTPDTIPDTTPDTAPGDDGSGDGSDETGDAGGGSAPAAAVAASIFDVDTVNGSQVFGNNCQSCHQATGQGIPGAFPPLVGHAPELAVAEGGREYLANLLLYGLQGQIQVDGRPYNGVMPGWQQLSDEQIADVLNYVLTEWGNEDDLPDDYEAFTPDEIAAQRGQGRSGADVYGLRQNLELPE